VLQDIAQQGGYKANAVDKRVSVSITLSLENCLESNEQKLDSVVDLA
jgi:hypothetical protein